jgi:hypothetical protein
MCFERHGRGFRAHAGLDEMRRDAGGGLAAHIDGQRAAGAHHGDPIMRRQPVLGAMAGEEV